MGEACSPEVWTGAGAVIAALVGAVGVLWRNGIAMRERLASILEEHARAERDRAQRLEGLLFEAGRANGTRRQR